MRHKKYSHDMTEMGWWHLLVASIVTIRVTHPALAAPAVSKLIRLQPGMPPISFETAVDPSTQRIRVEAAHG